VAEFLDEDNIEDILQEGNMKAWKSVTTPNLSPNLRFHV
jgi:hypothetical protein